MAQEHYDLQPTVPDYINLGIECASKGCYYPK